MRLGALASFFLGAFLGLVLPIVADDGPPKGTSRALIVVGLPGDPEHESLFRSSAKRWQEWLTGSLGFVPADVRIFSGTRDELTREVESLRGKCQAADRLWVFVLAHANQDEGHALLHLPGPDINDDQFGVLFRDIPCREQVFWMTNPASGPFLKPLAKAGRIVIAATEPDGESNETEFPHALAEVSRRPPDQLDRNKDGRVSVLEIFEATAQAVADRFATDSRAPTEHARIDDNGDGVGLEFQQAEKPANPDGGLASATTLIQLPTPLPAKSPARSPNGTKPVVPLAR
jgi:hypothetical protein